MNALCYMADLTSESGAGMHAIHFLLCSSLSTELRGPVSHLELLIHTVTNAAGSSGHFDPTNQMVLRLEYLSEPDVKWAIFFIHVAEFVGLVVLVLFLAAKLETDDDFFIRDNTLIVVNLCFGVLLWLAVMEVFVIYLQHVFRTNRHASPSRAAC